MDTKELSKRIVPGQNNPLAPSEYPRMMYRRTDEEDRQVQTLHDDGRPKSWLVVNSFDGLLCDQRVVQSADDAEALSAEGWEISPAAAHGKVVGIAAATTAKDDEIASLRAQLAAAQSVGGDPEANLSIRRGPGRPPKEQAAA